MPSRVVPRSGKAPFDTRTRSNWQNTQPVIPPALNLLHEVDKTNLLTFIQIVNGRKVGGFAGGLQAVLMHPKSCRLNGSSCQAPPEIHFFFVGFNQITGRILKTNITFH